jgi:Fe-S cluster assembly protein SufB
VPSPDELRADGNAYRARYRQARGFAEPIARELPMEYALELNRLIELQMEGAVG